MRQSQACHFFVCQQCGKLTQECITDQAPTEYRINPGNPVLGLCAECGGGVPLGAIRYPTRLPRPKEAASDVGEDTPPDLTGEWATWADMAGKFCHKAQYQDAEDLRHTIILTLALYRARVGEPLTEGAMVRIASCALSDYYRQLMLPRGSLPCGRCAKAQRAKCTQDNLHGQCRKGYRVVSLSTEVVVGEGHTVELGDTIADDKALDLAAWVDARVWLRGCKRRLIEIAVKVESGVALSKTDRQYLWRFRKEAQGRLF